MMMQHPKLKRLRNPPYTATASISQSWTNAREDIVPKPTKKKRSPIRHISRAITCPARQAFYENLMDESRWTKKATVRKVYASRGPSPPRYPKCTRSWTKQVRQRARPISPNSRGAKPIPQNIHNPMKYPTSVLVSSNQVGRDSFNFIDSRRRSFTSHHPNDMFLLDAPHLKYGMFGKKRGKIKMQSNRSITVKTSQKTTVMTPSDHPNTVRRDRRKLQRKVTPAPMFVFRTIDKRVTKQLGFSEVMHLDIKPLKNPPMSPYRNLSPVPYQMLPQTQGYRNVSPLPPLYRPTIIPSSRNTTGNGPLINRADEPTEAKPAMRGSRDRMTQKSRRSSKHHVTEEVQTRSKQKFISDYSQHFSNFKEGLATVEDQ